MAWLNEDDPFNQTGNYGKLDGGRMNEGGIYQYDNPGVFTGDTVAWRPAEAAFAHREGIPSWYAGQVSQAGAAYNPNQANIDAARGLQASGRGGLLDTLKSMQNRPLESQAMSEAMMRQGQQQVAGNLASQMASAPGRFSPAAMRQAQYGMASAGQNMALTAQQQAMAAAMAERQARDQAAIQGYGQLDQNDIRRLIAEQQQQAAQQDFWAKQQAAQQGWASQGMTEKAMEAAARQAYERARQAGAMGKDIPDSGFLGDVARGAIQATGSAVAAL